MHKNRRGDGGRRGDRGFQSDRGKQVDSAGPSRAPMDFKDMEFDMKTILKDIEHLSSSHMTWKERKEFENKKVVSLGGKPQKGQRLPLSVAKVQMKKRKEREEKMLKESMILGRFIGKPNVGSKKFVGKRRPEDNVLKASEGYFRNGILDVKNLLNQTPSREHWTPSREYDTGGHVFNQGKKKKGSGKKRGKKGGGKKRH
ncbi:hypothetical protein FNV43_RR24335 [Rhamnella rubrinervis]|uniref:Uncharacterized protein n=1 Tax=Rhamnella rubrinervis TaxID=2594499 RepID=A0A8K0DS82_9ROSA|nr:hypothetical protein FNV43_RR24335 [Rhamnella rubrinervis]